MSIGIVGYILLLVYAAKKVPAVAASILRYLTLGAKHGQEDSDARTIAFIAAMRAATNDGDQITVEALQELVGRNHPCYSHTWGIRTKYGVKDGLELEHYINRAIERTCPEDIDFKNLPKSNYKQCSAEWEAPRRFKGTIADLTPKEQYNVMLEECPDKELTFLYIHGGAHYLGNETGHRPLVRKLAKMSGGKAFSIRYRLSPQNPFPASLTDSLAAYEYLVNPPPDALHKPINPKKLIIAGDSAGGNLALALSAVLIESRPRWELPAGLILLSPWGDLTHSLPSCRYAPNDYLPEMHGALKSHKASEAWAGDGKQRQFYTTDTMLLHPLVSPILYEGWSALKAVIIQTGAEERLRDEGRYIAYHMSKLGVKVQYHEHRSMPHVFQMLFHTKASHTSFTAMAQYAIDITRGESIRPCRVLRSSRSPDVELVESQATLYEHNSIHDLMEMSREYFGRPWPKTKSLL